MTACKTIYLRCNDRSSLVSCAKTFRDLDAVTDFDDPAQRYPRTFPQLRRAAAKAGWTYRPCRFRDRSTAAILDKDFCPDHKPEPVTAKGEGDA